MKAFLTPSDCLDISKQGIILLGGLNHPSPQGLLHPLHTFDHIAELPLSRPASGLTQPAVGRKNQSLWRSELETGFHFFLNQIS